MLQQDGWVDFEGFSQINGLAYRAYLPDGYHELANVPPDRRVLAFHGWLDNAGSLSAVAELLCGRGYLVVALDAPGCGLSPHHSAFTYRTEIEELLWITKAVDGLNWMEPFIFMGHSRGGDMCVTFAGAMPHRVRCCICIEGNLGTLGVHFPQTRAGGFHGDLRYCLRSDRTNRNRETRTFATIEDAIDKSVNHLVFKKSRQAAEPIVRRHMKQNPDGTFTFTHDTRLYAPNSTRLIEEKTNLELLKNIRAPVLQIVASVNTLSTIAPFLEKSDIEKEEWEEALPQFVKTFSFSFGQPPSEDTTVLIPYMKQLLTRMRSIKEYTLKTMFAFHHLHGDHPQEVFDMIFPWLMENESRFNVDGSLPIDMRRMNDDEITNHERSLTHLSFTSYANAHRLQEELDRLLLNLSTGKESKSVMINEVEIGYQDFGSMQSTGGQCFVCYCDWGENSGRFQRWARELNQIFGPGQWRLIAIDPVGFGQSARGIPDDFLYAVSDEAAILIQFIELVLGKQPFVFVGHGRGGQVGLFASGAMPELFHGGLVIWNYQTCTIPVEWAPSEMTFAIETWKQPQQVGCDFQFATFADFVQALMTDPVRPIRDLETACAVALRRCANVPNSNQFICTDDSRALSNTARKPIMEIPHSRLIEATEKITSPVLIINHANARQSPLMDFENVQKARIEMLQIENDDDVGLLLRVIIKKMFPMPAL